MFDSSYERGRPLTFKIGVHEVIQGWDMGILGTEGVPAMKEGGKRYATRDRKAPALQPQRFGVNLTAHGTTQFQPGSACPSREITGSSCQRRPDNTTSTQGLGVYCNRVVHMIGANSM